MAKLIISRQQAKRLKARYFYTGIECENGHKSIRYVASGKCCDCNQRKPKRSLKPEFEAETMWPNLMRGRTFQDAKSTLI